MPHHISRQSCQRWDAQDPLASVRQEFELPTDLVYLDGNSLGAMPRRARERVENTLALEWGRQLIRSWNGACWFTKPRSLGDRIGGLLGAAPGQTVITDSTSVNLYKAIVAAARLRPGRHTILVERQAFPTDIYIATGAARAVPDTRIRLIDDSSELEQELTKDVAAVVLGHVDFRTGTLLDMPALTGMIHAAGALAIWDLCHSAGALPVVLDASTVDIAVGCTYKYLNGGPGSPAFIYVAHRHLDHIEQPLTGWNGHATPFSFSTEYQPHQGIDRLRVGTPAVLSMVALEGALDVWDQVEIDEIRAKSLRMTRMFAELLVDSGLDMLTPTQEHLRGSQISLTHPDAYAIIRALIDRGVIGDFREPDVLRFGFAPSYLRYVDVYDAATQLLDVLRTRSWNLPEYTERLLVT
ncbi:kynureninase [Sciscionella marina]|uniref:kynureninase n=1 Tax=Sciscionella marina TaxID=508770 RepID=UPI000370B65B|nr:kynureninase [Sciscionella marina]